MALPEQNDARSWPTPDGHEAEPEAARHLGLDLIRGLAALVVLVYHADFMFGLRDRLLPGGYLAVDLFLVLSGVVIGCTYDQALRTGRTSLGAFMIRRMARLYPLYLLTFGMGLVVVTARLVGEQGYLDGGRITAAALANLLLLPSFSVPYGDVKLFPFNGASWSIAAELAVNLLFALVLTRLKAKPLLVAWALAGIALAGTAWWCGTLDVGWSTRNPLGGLPRAGFSFITGLMLWRRFAARPWPAPGWLLAALLAGCGALFQARLWVPAPWHACMDLAAVVTLLPALVAAGVGVRLSGWTAAMARVLGGASYAVYLLQGSLIIAASGLVPSLCGREIDALGPLPGLVFVPVVLGVSHLCLVRFEMPARLWLRALAAAPRTGPSPQPQAARSR